MQILYEPVAVMCKKRKSYASPQRWTRPLEQSEKADLWHKVETPKCRHCPHVLMHDSECLFLGSYHFIFSKEKNK